MRALPLLLLLSTLAACADDDPALSTECPTTVAPGSACSTTPETWCYTAGDVCGLSWGTSSFAPCHCVNGAFACDDLYPTDGSACPYPDPISCSREGPPGCDPIGQPSGASCTCSAGTWTCDDTEWCDCPATYRPSLENAACSSPLTCTYPDHTCTCPAGQLTCTTP